MLRLLPFGNGLELDMAGRERVDVVYSIVNNSGNSADLKAFHDALMPCSARICHK